MKLFPDTKAGRIRAWIIAGLLFAVCAYRNVFALGQLALYRPQEGDILFQSLPHGELVDAIEGVTSSPWSHCGVLMKVEGHWQVVEAIGQVRRTPLALWIMRGRSGGFAAYRLAALPAPAGLHEHLLPALIHYLGRPYDFHYAPGDAEIYCSELVFKAYHDGLHVELGAWEELGHLNWQPYEPFIRSLEEGPVPMDRRMITPAGLARSPLLTRVYPKSG